MISNSLRQRRHDQTQDIHSKRYKDKQDEPINIASLSGDFLHNLINDKFRKDGSHKLQYRRHENKQRNN